MESLVLADSTNSHLARSSTLLRLNPLTEFLSYLAQWSRKHVQYSNHILGQTGDNLWMYRGHLRCTAEQDRSRWYLLWQLWSQPISTCKCQTHKPWSNASHNQAMRHSLVLLDLIRYHTPPMLASAATHLVSFILGSRIFSTKFNHQAFPPHFHAGKSYPIKFYKPQFFNPLKVPPSCQAVRCRNRQLFSCLFFSSKIAPTRICSWVSLDYLTLMIPFWTSMS